MTSRDTFSPLRLGAEGVLIVISILSAFALDAWWDARLARQEEADVLVRLRAEAVSNRDQLLERIDNHRSVQRAAEAILALTGSSAPTGLSADSVGRLIDEASSNWTYDPANGVLESLIVSGRLGIISSDSLQTELAGWPAMVRDMQEDEQPGFRALDTRITPAQRYAG
ncbi:MAG: hypothetical protein Q8N53_12170 [Longimicrobiales bacterium]|nr:hypothetical protein [Longimicrobiales bacterium]